MSFLYPSFLFGLLAISIPIIIHLFNLQRPKKVLFTNVRFLREVQQTTTNKLKLKHLLILLSRILFLTFLTLAFAQPFLSGENTDAMKGSPLVAVYTDNSFSMQNDAEGGNAFDIAVRSVGDLAGFYSANTKYILTTNDFEGKDQFKRNRDKLRERLTELNYSGTYRDASTVTNRIQRLFEKESNTARHLFFISDFQKSTLGDLGKLSIDSSVQYYLIPVKSREVSNIYIDSIWLSSPLIKMGENNSVEVEVYNEGTNPAKNFMLKLFIENVQVSTATVDLPAKGSAKTKFIFNLNKPGQQRCSIRFDDSPVNFDNEYFFVLNVAPKIKVLHLYDGEGKYVRNVYSGETVFEVSSASSGDFDYSKINSSDLIVLDNIRSIPSTLLQPLKDFTSKGGSLMIFPSNDLQVASYEQLSAALGLATLRQVKTDTTGNKLTYELLPPDPAQPFFSNVFEKADGRINMPYAFPVLEWSGHGNNILTLKTNDPYMTLFNSGKGRVYLACSPLTDATTNIHRHALFVPLMYKAAFNSVQESERLSWSFQENTIAVDLENAGGNDIYSLESDKLKLVPAQRVSGNKLILELPRDGLKAGFFQLKQKDKSIKWLALNYGKQESSLDCYSKEELVKAYSGKKNVKIYEMAEGEDFTGEFKKDHIGVSLWKYCLILSLLFLLTEILLIRFL